jgi:hypothetical protein
MNYLLALTLSLIWCKLSYGGDFNLAPIPLKESADVYKLFDPVEKNNLKLIKNFYDGEYTPLTFLMVKNKESLIYTQLYFDFDLRQNILGVGLVKLGENPSHNEMKFTPIKISSEVAANLENCSDYFLNNTSSTNSNNYLFDNEINFIFSAKYSAGFCSNVAAESELGNFLISWLTFIKKTLVSKELDNHNFIEFSEKISNFQPIIKEAFYKPRLITIPSLEAAAYSGRLLPPIGLDLSIVNEIIGSKKE